METKSNQLHPGAPICYHCKTETSMFYCKTADCDKKYFCVGCVEDHDHPKPGRIFVDMQANLEKGNKIHEMVNDGIDKMKQHIDSIVSLFNAYKLVFDSI